MDSSTGTSRDDDRNSGNRRGRSIGSDVDDSFRNYMARKIDLQRQQFGLVLPPDPGVVEGRRSEGSRKEGSQREAVSAEDDLQNDVLDDLATISSTKRRRKEISAVAKPRNSKEWESTADRDGSRGENADFVAEMPAEVMDPSQDVPIRRRRSDLFFAGVVVLVNGFTNPDAATIMRMLHKHGGDVEKYETGRVTHIIAEHLSTAKAKIYKRQRRPTPVCRPEWIVQSVASGRLLPHADYIIEEVMDEGIGNKTVKSFFSPQPSNHNSEGDAHDPPRQSSESIIEKLTPRHLCKGVERLSGKGTQDQASEGVDKMLHDNDSVETQAPKAEIDDHQTVTSDTGIGVSKIPPFVHSVGSLRMAAGKRAEGSVRTVGTDPDFLESFFSNSRLSFIGSFKQRVKNSGTGCTAPVAKANLASTKRIVFHVDMDSFFAAVVLRNYPQYKDKPVAISHAGRGSQNSGHPTDLEMSDSSSKRGAKKSTSECATCNYVARQFGIKKGMFLGRAKELCPDLIVLEYDFEGYEEVSEQVSDILHSHFEPYHATVEQVSCDESYVEILVDGNQSNEAQFELAEALAESIRSDVFASTRCTASVGVGPNKFLAKLATDKVKPDGLCVVRKWEALLEDLMLRDLPGIGYRMERKLQSLSLVSIRDVWALGDEAESELCRILGPGNGKKIMQFCKGKDGRPVQAAGRKTIGAECNYGVRFDGPYGVDYMISGLAKEVQKRMEGVGVYGRKITLKLKQRKQGAKPPPKFLGHGSCHNLSKSCDFPGSCATRDSNVMARLGMKLYEQMGVSKDDIRGMGVVVSKLESSGGQGTSSTSMSTWLQRKMGHKEKEAHRTDAKADTSLKSDEEPHVQRVSILNKGVSSKSRVVRFAAEIQYVEGSRSFDVSRKSMNTQFASVTDAKEVDEQGVGHVSSPIRRKVKRKLFHSTHDVGEPLTCPKNVTEKGWTRSSCESHSLSSRKIRSHSRTGEPGNILREIPESGSPHTDSQQREQVVPLAGLATGEEQADTDSILSRRRDGPEEMAGEVALPPINEIDMESVMALPPTIRAEVLQKIHSSAHSRRDRGVGESGTLSPLSPSRPQTTPTPTPPKRNSISAVSKRQNRSDVDDDSVRFRQVSVKRMLKLASVKSGHETLECTPGGTSVSLTQLECLPLEMQLQVANNDEACIGKLSPRTLGSRQTCQRLSPPLANSMDSNKPHCSRMTDSSPEKSTSPPSRDEVTVASDQQHPSEEFLCEEVGNFYRDNLMPLREWMNSRSEPSGRDVEQVEEFFRICIAESRLDEVVVMLRLIRNRGDSWSKGPYRTLLEASDRNLFSIEGRRLDTEWVGLS